MRLTLIVPPPMRFAIACLAAFAAISSSMGEELRWRQLSPRAAEADRGAAVIREAKVSAEIHGWLARTDYEMVVGAKTEGSGETQVQVAAEFSLREGDVICGFGIDIGGEIRPASGADSARARIAYESVVRRMIDPGLVEQIGENRYRIRVFPVTATAPRTIHLRIDSLLTEIGDRLEYRPPLDLAAEDAIDFQIAAHGAEPRWEGREFQPEGGRPQSWQLRRALRDLGEVAVSVAAPGGDVTLVGDDGGAHYFAVRPAIEPGGAMPPGRRVALFWDTSGSLADIDAARILEKVAVWMLRRSAREVVLIPFSVGMGAPQRFELRDGGWTALEKAVGELLYDGGTHFGALDFAAERCDIALVVTDGRGTWAGPNPAAAPGADAAALPPVHVFDLDGGAIDPALEEAVAATGGRLFGLDHQYVARSSVALGTADYALDQGQGAHAPAFYGAMHSEAARLRFAYQGGDEREIRVLARDAKFSPAGPLLRVRFAKAAADQIAAGGAANDRRLSAHGRDAGIVTARSSLIVLERLSDYLRHKIDPPPALAKEFHAAQREAAAANDRAANDAPSNPELARDYWTGLDAEWWRASPEALNLDPFLAYQKFGSEPREASKRAKLQDVYGWRQSFVVWQRYYSERREARAQFESERAEKAAKAKATFEKIAAEISPAKADGHAAQLRKLRDAAEGASVESRWEDLRPTDEDAPFSADSFGSSDPFGSSDGGADPFAAAAGPAPAGPPPSRFGPESAPASAGPSAADSIAEAGSAGKGSDLRPLRLAAPGDHAGVYRALRRQQPPRPDPAWCFDAALILWQNGEPALALRALSNLSELELGNPSLARAQAFALGAWGKHRLAAALIQRGLGFRDDAAAAQRELAEARLMAGDLRGSAAALAAAIRSPDASRALVFAAARDLAALSARDPGAVAPEDRGRLLGEGAAPAESRALDLRVVLEWDAPGADIDLVVVNPRAERCSWLVPLATDGGRLCIDSAAGGPEEFALRHALPGTYRLRAEWPGWHRDGESVLVKATVITGFGTAGETRAVRFARLTKEMPEADLGDWRKAE